MRLTMDFICNEDITCESVSRVRAGEIIKFKFDKFNRWLVETSILPTINEIPWKKNLKSNVSQSNKKKLKIFYAVYRAVYTK